MADTEQGGASEQAVPEIDTSHPALGDDPRADRQAERNRIDLNDPRLSGAEAVARALAAQAERA